MSNSRLFDNPMIAQANLHFLPTDVVQLIAASHLSVRDTAHLAQSCKQLWRPLQPVLNKKLQTFLQAVIDDDQAKVSKLLNDFPGLARAIPPQDMVIESQCTWQKFMAENALSMAVKRKQLDMIQLLVPYHDRPEEVLLVWPVYQMDNNAEDGEKIIIPQAYVDIIQRIITAFTQEEFTEGQYCTATEDALSHFYEMLLPVHAVTLDNYVDIELLLYAAYKMYDDHFNDFQNWEQSDAFCIRVIGFLQSLVTPETAKIFCEGLYDVVMKNKKISDRAASLQLLEEQPFYRSSRESRSGLGFDFICGRGEPTTRLLLRPRHIYLERYLEKKQQDFRTLCSDRRNTHSL